MSKDSITFICQTGYKCNMTIELEKESIKKEIERRWNDLKLPYKYYVYFFENRNEKKNDAFPGEIIRIIITYERQCGYFFPYFFVTDKPVKHICCNVTDIDGTWRLDIFRLARFIIDYILNVSKGVCLIYRDF
jgi:hypothetical protein